MTPLLVSTRLGIKLMRQIVLDTETTGISIEDGHRIIEIGCIELIDRKFSHNNFHVYINPGREIDKGALAVHGISNQFLQDKPDFITIAKEFINYISGAELIIHNASFDVGFLNYELQLANLGTQAIDKMCKVIDTLKVARQLHVGQRNSLDALCKRYNVDLSKRDLHGALLDANLLAQVYLSMTGGQSSLFDTLKEEGQSPRMQKLSINSVEKIDSNRLLVLKANEDELIEHEKYLQLLKAKNKCLWLND
jgi:DNA polymerase III subunit epsilon